MHVPSRRILQDTVTAIRLRRAISELGLEGSVMLSAIFGARTTGQVVPSCAAAASTEIADRCKFSLDELRYEYPEDLVPPDYTAHGWLRELTEAGIARWPGVQPLRYQSY